MLLDDRGKNSRCGASLDVPSVPSDSDHFAYLKDRILRLMLHQASDLQSCVWNDLILFRDVNSKAWCAFLVLSIEVPRILYLDWWPQTTCDFNSFGWSAAWEWLEARWKYPDAWCLLRLVSWTHWHCNCLLPQLRKDLRFEYVWMIFNDFWNSEDMRHAFNIFWWHSKDK